MATTVRNIIYSALIMAFTFFAPDSNAASIKIGLMAPLTGSFASEGQDMQKILATQVEEINKAGGINGSLVTLVVEDDGSSPRPAVNAANRLISKDIKYIIGTYGSAITEATQDIYDEVGVIQIATGSTSIRLTNKGFEHFFRTCPRDDEQGRVAVSTLMNLGFKKIALLHDNSAYGKGLAEEIKPLLEKVENVSVVFYDALQPNERDYTTIITKIKGTKPDAIMFTGYYPEAGMLLRQMAEMKWIVPMLGADAANNIDLVKIAGVEAAKGYRFVSPPVPKDLDQEETKAFLSAYTAKYGSGPSSIWSVVAGDAFLALVDAIEHVGDDVEAVTAYLHQLKDLHVLTGTLGFDSKGDRRGDLYRLYEVNDKGEFVLQPK